MAIHRLKRSFTAGELSPYMTARVDTARYNAGCDVLKNAYAIAQGPAVRRSGTEFLQDLSQYVTDMTLPIIAVDCIPFIFSEEQAYVLIFLTDSADPPLTRLFIGYQDGLVADPLVPSNPYIVDTTTGIIAKQFTHAQAGDKLFIAQRDVAPLELQRLASDDWQYVTISFTDPPAEWVADDYPGHVTLYEQRLVYASNVSLPQTFWFSKAGSFYDFGVSAPLVESDAITFTIASGQQNRVQWLASAKQLLIGTLGNEWVMSGSGGNPISYKSVVATRQTNNGGEQLPSLMVGTINLFIERLGRSVRRYAFNLQIDGHQSIDLSILAPHLTEKYSIVDWDYQQTPNSIVWCVRSDGVLLGLTLQNEHQVVGWHRHDTNGNFRAVACIPDRNSREDEVWFIVEREIEGTPKFYLERFTPEFKSESTVDAWFVDSGARYSGTPVTSVSGLDHLEGEEVQILADGAVRAPQIVSGGSVPIGDLPAETVIVGLQFTSDISPLLPDFETTLGSTLGRTQRVTNVTILLYRSLGLKYGYDEDNLEELPFRDVSDLTGVAIPLFSGEKKINFPEGYHSDSSIFIRQDEPLPLTVLGTVDEIEVRER